MWGVGNVSYGLTMRHLGMSLGIGVAIGVTLVVGTLVPPLMHGQAAMLFTTRSGLLTMAGILVALIGIAVVSYAGHQKEMQLGAEVQGVQRQARPGARRPVRHFFVGHVVRDRCGPADSAAAQQWASIRSTRAAQLRAHHGRRRDHQLGYCFIRLAVQEGHLAARRSAPAARDAASKMASLAATGGIMWYLQFFFYAWGAANIPQRLSYVNWMLHMSIYVLCGGLVGLALGEWKGVAKRPIRLLWAGILVIIAAANLVGWEWHRRDRRSRQIRRHCRRSGGSSVSRPGAIRSARS